MKEKRRAFNIPETAKCRLCAKYISCYKLLIELSAFLECGLYQGQTLILEVRGEDGDWPRDNISLRSMEAKTSIPMNCKGCKEKDEKLLEVMEMLWSKDVRSMNCKDCKEKDALLEVMERLWSKDVRSISCKDCKEKDEQLLEAMERLWSEDVRSMSCNSCNEKDELLEVMESLWSKEDLEEISFCKICIEAPIGSVMLECGHMCSCTNCGKQMKECPICRQEVVRVVRTFKA